MIDERQRRNDGDKIEKPGTQICNLVPIEAAAGKKLNRGNGSENNIKYHQLMEQFRGG